MGDKVKIKYVDNGAEVILQLVEEVEEAGSNIVSIASPLGEAMHGQLKGNIMEVRTP